MKPAYDSVPDFIAKVGLAVLIAIPAVAILLGVLATAIVALILWIAR